MTIPQIIYGVLVALIPNIIAIVGTVVSMNKKQAVQDAQYKAILEHQAAQDKSIESLSQGMTDLKVEIASMKGLLMGKGISG